MPEWLSGDPMNGLVITVAFFISLITGRYLRESIDNPGNRGKSIDPGIRLIIAFLLIITVTLMEHWYFPASISILGIIIAYKLRLFHDYSKYMIFPLAMALFILAVQGFTTPYAIEPGIIASGSSRLEYGFLVFSRIFASASVFIILLLTTSENELLESLRRLRFPATVIEISSFMSRYIRTFSNEGNKIRFAQESRMGLSGSFFKKMQDTAMICGLLITRTFERSEEINRAMVSRGWKPGIRYSQEIPQLRMSEVYIFILLISGLLGIVFIDRSI